MNSSFWQRLLHGTREVKDRADWAAVVGSDWADHIMEVQVTDDFHAKQGRSTGRWAVAKDGRRLAVYLKRHYRLPWWRGLLATIFPKGNWSPALQEWHNLCDAQSKGLRVPAPVAVGQFVGPWFRLQSVLAVEELTDMLPLHQAIPLAARCLGPDAFVRWKRVLIRELARMARVLHRRCFFHKDLYLCHFYLPRADIEKWDARQTPSFRDRLHMIDLHRLASHRWTWPMWQLKDLAQLLFSSDVEGITARDRVMFWQSYRGGIPRSRLLRCAEWCIRLKWLRYRDHNRKREKRSQQDSEQKKVAA